jgi:hypothetical protein
VKSNSLVDCVGCLSEAPSGGMTASVDTSGLLDPVFDDSGKSEVSVQNQHVNILYSPDSNE